MSVQVLHGDCLEVLRTLPDCSVDAVVTDPPYGLSKEPDMAEVLRHWLAGDDYQHKGGGFMGKSWDSFVPGPSIWRECLRVLKPGGHLLAFFGTRTQDMGTLAIRLAGFEIRDSIAWVYASGFPKSLDVSKAIDKAAGAEREVVGYDASKARPNKEGFAKVTASVGERQGNEGHKDNGATITAPATEAARQWAGWGTALKPALEPITVARKPLIGTVAENVLRHGTGGLNIDGCRVGTTKNVPASVSRKAQANCYGKFAESGETQGVGGHDPNLGRWPANLIHDGSEEVLAGFPSSNGSGPARTLKRGQRADGDGWGMQDEAGDLRDAGTGSAARFFYCAKASRSDRNEGLTTGSTPAVGTGATMRECENADWQARNSNHHPTVKPTALMRYLCRLVTPPDGVVLDPFMGSGSTGKAATLEGFGFIGIEREAEYVEIARARIEAARPMPVVAPDKPAVAQLDMFEALARG